MHPSGDATPPSARCTYPRGTPPCSGQVRPAMTLSPMEALQRRHMDTHASTATWWRVRSVVAPQHSHGLVMGASRKARFM